MVTGGCQVAHEVGGRAQGGRARPTLVDGGAPPLELLPLNIFINSINDFRGVSGLLELCRIGL